VGSPGLSIRISGEDHNSADRENDEHREPRVGSVVCFSHHAGPKKSPTADRYGAVGRRMRHAIPRSAVAHDRPQELTSIQFEIRDKYVAQSKGAPWGLYTRAKAPWTALSSRGSRCPMTGLLLVNKTSRRCVGLCANPLRTFEICHATVPSHVSDARPDRHLKHRHSKHYADDGNLTAGQA
jgi:hypothetical protein